ncbi:hypothetical protein Tco_0408705 [Tanacetum coccineum]
MVRLVKHGLEEFVFEVVKWIDDKFMEELEKLGWWFEQDIGDEGGWMKRMKMIVRIGSRRIIGDVFKQRVQGLRRNGAFGEVRDEEVIVGEGVVVTSSSLEMLTNSCLGGIMVSLIFLEWLEEEALVEVMVEFG